MKFWNKADNDIFIYGDISSDKFFDTDVTAKEFADDLSSCKGAVTVHINSNGGDCFTALAISNLMKSSANFITVAIEGICASAATLIACGGNKITMAENALMMIHAPSVGLMDFMTAEDLAKVQESLSAVKSAIIETYKNRTGLEVTELEKMVDAETWLTATEAKELGFIDEITGAVAEKIDNSKRLIILNSVTLKQNYYSRAKEKLNMKSETLLEKITNLLGGKKNQTAESARVESLQKLKTENAAVNAIIDVAIKDGAKAEDVQKYLDAVANVEVTDKVADKILALIEDNLKSGAESVGGSFEVDKSKAQAESIANFANKMR